MTKEVIIKCRKRKSKWEKMNIIKNINMTKTAEKKMQAVKGRRG